jgi:sec-independent protein translocase protein TatC
MSFLSHLEVLRWHLVRAVIAILVVAITVFLFNDFVFGEIVFGPTKADFFTFKMFCKITDAFCIDDMPFVLRSAKPMQQFTTHISSSIIIGFIFAFPYVFWELWSFIKPALYTNEKNVANGTVFFVSLLFGLGVLFGYYLVAPLSLNFLTHYQLTNLVPIENIFDVPTVISFITMISLANGLMFQLPMVVYFLTKVGLVNPDMLKYYRKHALIGILVLSAVLTPPDVTSQVLVSMPIFLLYEISIMISRRVQKNQMKELYN